VIGGAAKDFGGPVFWGGFFSRGGANVLMARRAFLEQPLRRIWRLFRPSFRYSSWRRIHGRCRALTDCIEAMPGQSGGVRSFPATNHRPQASAKACRVQRPHFGEWFHDVPPFGSSPAVIYTPRAMARANVCGEFGRCGRRRRGGPDPAGPASVDRTKIRIRRQTAQKTGR